MSVRSEYLMSLAGMDLSGKTEDELVSLYNKLLNSGMHGLCFSPYEEGQEPGTLLSEEQIRRRIDIIKPHTKWVRSFSCTEGNELIPKIAKENGMKTLVGAWLGKYKSINENEIAGLIEVTKAGHADIVAVGNEVLYREDLSEDELLDYIYRVKKALPGIPVGYVDAYYEFGNRPRITTACDVILANCYPFWEGCSLDYSYLYMKDMYNRALKAGNGKKVIITETGWPNVGEKFHGAKPSKANALKYFINTQLWSKEENIDIFYFSSFDEAWKTSDEGDVGAYWGIWDKDENLKFSK
ncbi:glycosyl hydrolase [Labilibaculum sp. A4]|uniref:glycoside hydrolase family 17 protein n=1 Tax=Labilibaculum euxinus TaxID=2686357 RepID=UPI000F618E0B|nr:glycosyl hydrolase family 17 protein [Labilibaculum euxinus]MDQ1770606.1 glycosyl hydrolase family 17 protein [Labilibaculum euxinus]MWN75174.1 glycosyl hydrolase [Labilibaculum euxinus]